MGADPHPCHSHGTTTNKARRRSLFGSLDWIFRLLVPGTLAEAFDSNTLGDTHSFLLTGQQALESRPATQTYLETFTHLYLL